MPIYEYKCANCGYECERIESIDVLLALGRDLYKRECAVCRKDELIRKTSLTAPPRFKGPGFYETDYKGKK